MTHDGFSPSQPLLAPLPVSLTGCLSSADAAATRKAFADLIYGSLPTAPATPWKVYDDVAFDPTPIPGAGALQRLMIGPIGDGRTRVPVLLAMPARYTVGKPVPVILGLCRGPLAAVLHHPDWTVAGAPEIPDPRDCAGGQAMHWSLSVPLAAGIAVAIMEADRFAPDDVTAGRGVGFAPHDDGLSGALSRWAWGLMRLVDVLTTYDRVDRDRLWLFGHSRRGKAALWAAAHDPRIAAVIAHQSGCLGAALNRHPVGETVRQIVDRFPHWFRPDLAERADRPEAWAVDQHQLLALIAPRRLLISNGVEDCWADPVGQGIALTAAAPAWQHPAPAPPKPSHLSVTGALGHLVLPGGHRCGPDYWRLFCQFLIGVSVHHGDLVA